MLVFLYISVSFFQFVFAADVPNNIDRTQLQLYVKELVDVRVNEIIASCDSDGLNKADIRIKDIEQQEWSQYVKTNSGQNSLSAPKRHQTNAGSPVGFTACVGVPDLLNLNDKDTIIFSSVITNEGGAYHNQTGVFIAPVKGLYVFHLSAMSLPHKEQILTFVKNGVALSHVYPDASGSQDYQTAGSQWVVILEQGSEVWIQTSGTGEIHGHCYTAFSGFLLGVMQ